MASTEYSHRDIEWETANNANETPRYYKVEMYNGGTCYKKYKPSVAELVAKRTGLKIEQA